MAFSVLVITLTQFLMPRAAGLSPALRVAAGVPADCLLLPPPLHPPHRGPGRPRGQPRPPVRLIRRAVSPGDQDDDHNAGIDNIHQVVLSYGLILGVGVGMARDTGTLMVSIVMMMLMITIMMIVTGGSVFQEEAGAGGDLPGVGEWPGDLCHVELGEVGHQGDWLEAGPAGDQVTLTQISDDGCGLNDRRTVYVGKKRRLMKICKQHSATQTLRVNPHFSR